VFTPGLLVVVIALALAALSAVVDITAAAPAGQLKLGLLQQLDPVLSWPAGATVNGLVAALH
jgi:hypothetical protein